MRKALIHSLVGFGVTFGLALSYACGVGPSAPSPSAPSRSAPPAAALESITLNLMGNGAFTISSPELPSLSNTCFYVPSPSGQTTSCLNLLGHSTYHFVSTAPLLIASGCDFLSIDRLTCTVVVAQSRRVSLSVS